MAAEAERLGKFETFFISRDPEVVTPAAQLSYPPEPEFRRIDVPVNGLSCQTEITALEVTCRHRDAMRDFIPFLYTYRSLSRSVNTNEHLKPAQDDKKYDMAAKYMQIYSALFRPRLNRMFELKKGVGDAVTSIGEIAAKFRNPSDVLLGKIVELLEVLFNIDQMKLLKSGMTNDLSIYRRQKALSKEEVMSTGELQPFLAQRYESLEKLKNQTTPQSVSFWTCMLEYCVRIYESSFVLANQKGSIVTTIVSTFYVCVAHKLGPKDVVTSACQIVEKNPLMPIYAEISYMPGAVMASLPGFVPPKSMTFVTDKDGIKAIKDQFSLTGQLEKFREVFKANLTKITQIAKDSSIELGWLYDTMSCVSEMARAVMCQLAYKCAVPAPPPNNGTEKICVYDCQIRFNFTGADLDALIEIIGNLKTMANYALRGEPTAMGFIYQHVAKTVQNFVQVTLEQLLEATGKKEKDVEAVIIAIRNNFGQWNSISQPDKKAKKYTSRCFVPPTVHQLDILRTQVQSLYSPSGPCADKNGKLRGYMKGKLVDQLQEFVSESRKFYPLLKYAQEIRECTNLGGLWFRETSLDIEQKLQYPVRSSLPFILSEYILSATDRPSLNDSVFFPFEIYNDAAYLALNTFKSQFLYKEIEAELSLCVDMISVNFARAFFRFAREAAAAAELPPECAGLLKPTPVRFGLMVKQNSLQLLGSQADFNLIAMRLLNTTFQQELTKCVKDITDLRAVPFTAHMFRVLQCTHEFLVRSGVRLDEWKVLLKKATSAADPLCPYTALTDALINCINPQHWVYNTVSRRFIPTKKFSIVQPTNEIWAQLYVRFHGQETRFIGAEHYMAMIEIMSDVDLSVFIQACLSRLDQELEKMIATYVPVAAVLRLLQPKNKDELISYFNYVSDAYSETKHTQLGALYNAMRIVGNLTAIIYGIECEMKPNNSPSSLIASVANIYRSHIECNRDLFIPREFDYEKQLSHRAFPSLWCILEFLLCSPNAIQLSEAMVQKHPLQLFGDGPVVCAHVLIAMSGQQGLYDYDSICTKALGLYQVQKMATRGDVSEFVAFAAFASQSKNFAQTMVHPYAPANAI